MVDMPVIVVVVSKSVIRVASVSGSNIVDPIEMDWQIDLLPRAFSVIKDRYKVTRIRLVLDEDLSHTLDLEIPLDTPGQSERSVVEQKLKEQIPEVLTAGNWDFKLKETKEVAKVVTVFVPVQETFIAFSDAATKSGIEIEAVEPISISTSRDPSPFIGMAQKTDLRGNDEEVLNIQPIFAAQEETGMLSTPPVAAPPAPQVSSSASGNSSRKKIGKIVIIVGGLLLVALLAYGVITAVKKTTPATPSPTPIPTPAAVTPTPSPTPEPVEISELKVQVLNGSGVPGEAGKVSNLLKKEDFADITTANADSYDFKTTVVSLKASMPSSVYDTIELALSGDYTVELGDELEESSDYDVVITVGVNSNATPTPKPTTTATPKASSSVSPSPSPSESASASASPST